MRKSRSAKALLSVSAAAGLVSLLGSYAHAAGTFSFTTIAGTPLWKTNANWTPTTSGYGPSGSGYTAIVSGTLAGAQTIALPGSPNAPTLATLIMGDTSGSFFAQTLGSPGTFITFDNTVNSAPAVLTEQAVYPATPTVSLDNLAGSIALNSDLTMNINAGGSGGNAKYGLTMGHSDQFFYGNGHNVTLNTTFGTEANRVAVNMSYGLNSSSAYNVNQWTVNSGVRLLVSGTASAQWFTGDVVLNPGSKLTNNEPDTMGVHDLITMNGDGAWSPGGSGAIQHIGGLQGSGGAWGTASDIFLEGVKPGDTNVIGSHPTYSGYLANEWTEMDGGTQELAGTAANTTGPTLVTGGLLILNKTPAAGVYAVSGAGLDQGSVVVTGGVATLQIDGGAVQLLQPNQIDPVANIVIDGGALKLTGNSQVSTLPLTLVSNPNDSSIINVIDFGTTNPSVTNTILSFADSSAITWNGSNQVQNWIGLLAGGGQDQFKVGSAATLSGGQLSALKFVNAEGTLGTSVGATQLASGEIVPSGLPAMWGGPAGGSWNAGGSWTNGSAPNATHAYANFVGSPFAVGLTGSAVTVTLDGSKTVGAVNFNSTNGVTVNAGSGGSLTINDSGDPAGVNPAIYVQRGTHAINVPVVMNNGLTVYMSNASSLTLGSTLTGPGNIAVTGAGTTTLGTTTVLPATANVAVSSGATLALPFAVGSQSVAGVSIDATSTLAVGKQMMSVPDATGLGSALYNTTVAEIKAGYVNHLGHGIVLTAGSPANAAVGIIDVSGTLKFGYTILGDATMDGSVGFNDLVKVAQNYNKTNTTWQSGDVSYDGTTNFSDLVKVAQNYTQHVTGEQVAQLDAIDPAFAANWSAAQAVAAAVPEPASLGLLAVGAVGLLSRRRRHA